jgi:hypothetical protein
LRRWKGAAWIAGTGTGLHPFAGAGAGVESVEKRAVKAASRVPALAMNQELLEFWLTSATFSRMLKDGKRHCDVCDQEIAKGSCYLLYKIEKRDIPPAVHIEPTTLRVDALGDVRMDICLTRCTRMCT